MHVFFTSRSQQSRAARDERGIHAYASGTSGIRAGKVRAVGTIGVPGGGFRHGRTRMTASLRVLVVEDQGDLRELMADVLGGICGEVRIAAEAESALAILRGGYACDVVFSDVHMPGSMSGAELGRIVVEEMQDVRVILASGHARHQLPRLPEGIDFMQKPYRLNQLVGLLKKIGAEKRLAAGLEPLRS